MDCRKTEVFLAEWYRMCCGFDGKESKCPVTLGCGIVQCANCRQLAMTGGDIIDIVQEWSDSHPVRTRLSVLKEKFPKAYINEDDGLPDEICAGNLYGFECYDGMNCVDCWNTPIEDGNDGK